MDDSSEILREHLNQVPDPLRSVIKEYLGKDILTTGLGDIKARHGLSDDQSEAALQECLMVLCNVTPLDELKDSLIAEAGLSYEAAVRIQRTFESEVLLPIQEEAEKRGYGANEIDSADEEQPVRTIPSGPLYDNPHANVRGVMQLGIQIFPGLIRVGGTAIPLRMISGVKAWEEPTDYTGLAVNGGLALLGAVLLFTFSFWSLVGIAMVLLGGFNVKNALVKKYNVTIHYADRESMLVMFKDQDAACQLRDAIEQALSAA